MSSSDDDEFVVVHHSDSSSSSSSSSSVSDFEDVIIAESEQSTEKTALAVVSGNDNDADDNDDDEDEEEGASSSETAGEQEQIDLFAGDDIIARKEEPLLQFNTLRQWYNKDTKEDVSADKASNEANQEGTQESEALLKKSYDGFTCSENSSIIMINGMDGDMYEILMDSNVESIGELALLAGDAIYSALSSALPDLDKMILRAQLLLDPRSLYDTHERPFNWNVFVPTPGASAPPPATSAPPPATPSPTLSATANKPVQHEDNLLQLNNDSPLKPCDVSPESSVAVLRSASDTDVAVLASLEILTIRQFHGQFQDVCEIMGPGEKDHYDALYYEASQVMVLKTNPEAAWRLPVKLNVPPGSSSSSNNNNNNNNDSNTHNVKEEEVFDSAPSDVSVASGSDVSSSTPVLSKTTVCRCGYCKRNVDTAISLKGDTTHLWVYNYVPEAVYQQIKEEKMLKSAYTLFNEYMNCTMEERPYHGWNRVRHAYLRDASKWMGRRVEVNNVTDADVFAFLVWRASFSFAASDCTAGPKAIYYTWCPIPKNQREEAICVDQIVAEDTRDPYVADRFARIIAIDLMRLQSHYAAKMYRADYADQERKTVDTNKWLPTTISEATAQVHSARSHIMWANFKSGESYFSNVPHGCVVVSRGYIPEDCIMFEDDFPEDVTESIVIKQ